jgi:hypothetical protein
LMVLALGGFGGALTYNAGEQSQDVTASRRNFYGVLRVKDSGTTFEEGSKILDTEYRYLLNGRILHGTQFTAAELRHVPTTYYTPNSGVGRLLRDPGDGKPRRVGLVGLGVGTLAVYARPGDQYRFYEINAAVPEIAHRYFSYLDDCRGTVTIVPGDARLTLDREPSQNFDVFVLDAFSGDAIPMHLLTFEAFGTYLKHLAPTGVIAVHISNRHFALGPVVQAIAEANNLASVTIDVPSDGRGGISSTWTLVSRDARLLTDNGISKDSTPPGTERVLWTDDRCSMFQILRERTRLIKLWQRITGIFQR